MLGCAPRRAVDSGTAVDSRITAYICRVASHHEVAQHKGLGAELGHPRPEQPHQLRLAEDHQHVVADPPQRRVELVPEVVAPVEHLAFFGENRCIPAECERAVKQLLYTPATNGV